MKINAYDVLRHAFYSVFRNMGQAVQFAWPWLLVLLVIGSGLAWAVIRSGFGQTPLEPDAGAATMIVAVLIGVFVYLVAFSSIAVNWHRYVLLDDTSPGSNRLRIDGHVWRYIGRGLLAGLMTMLVVIIPLLVVGVVLAFAFGDFKANIEEGPWWLRFIAQTVVGTFIVSVFFRYSLALPAAAVGRFDIGIFKSWQLTSGNFSSFVLIALGSTMLQAAADVVMTVLAEGSALLGSTVAGSVVIGLSVVFTWFFTFFGITLLTSLYGFFVENRAL